MNTMLCQLKSLLLLGVLLFANGAFGQPMIWDDTSPETIVFELTNKEALKLLKGKLRQKQWDKIQQTPFARFTDAWSCLLYTSMLRKEKIIVLQIVR